MKRLSLVLSLSLAIACGDDSSADDGAPDPKDASPTKDATLPTTNDAGKDAAPDLLDAAIEAGPAPVDATVEADASTAADASEAVDAASFDAHTRQDASADAGQCVAAGESCQDDVNSCCEDTACVTSSAESFVICAQKCAEDTDCDTGCCTVLPGSPDKVCAPQLHCAAMEPDPTAPLTGVNCIKPNVYDHNDNYMGVASSYGTEAVCDISSHYGPNHSLEADNVWSITGDAYEFSLYYSATIKCNDLDAPIAYISQYATDDSTRVIRLDNLCEVLDNSNL
jgi:hypothetical protein